MRPAAGVALGGRYRLDRRIAVGGMGEVWVGHDLSLGRDVAVKVLREEFAGDVGFLARFRTEARNAASLWHPNIAALLDYGEQDGSSYLVMELVPGEPLSDLLEREPVLPESRLVPVLAQTARALHAAHLAGVVHRDVKPGNILLGPGGRVKITDFGVSTAPDQAPMTATGMVMGTAQYLSPEQAVGRPATALSDLYSLGIVAYEALAGKRPFTGPTAVDIAVAHVNSPVPPLPPHVSPALAALVMRLLAKEPADRPPTAAALARSLDALQGHTPPEGQEAVEPARPATVPPRPAGSSTPAPARRAAPATTAPPAWAPPPRTTASSAGPPPAIAPPSYPPRRDLRDARRPPAGGPVTRTGPAVPPSPRPDPARPGDARAGGTRSGAPAPSGATRVEQRSAPVRTSTTTGRRLGRLGRLSWPLVALLLLLLGLLVAALADSVGGRPGADVPGVAASGCRCAVPSLGPWGIGGMISGVPSAGPDGADTTTAKDS